MAQLANVVIGAGLAILGSFLVQTYFGMRSARVELVNDFLTDLGEIEALATEYWHETTILEAVDPKRSIVAARLRGRLHAARAFKKHAEYFLGDDYATFDELDRELFRAATGGEFESPTAKQSLEQAHRVMVACTEIRSLLRHARRKAYWAH